jgi:hypothetical protein
MTESTITLGGAERVAQPEVAVRAGDGRRLRRRHLLLIPGLAIAIFANELGKQHGVGIVALIAFSIVPDVPRLLRFRGQPFGPRLAALAIPLSNVLHQPLVALPALVLAAAGAANDIVPIVALVASLVWFGHIVIGRAVGDGIRQTDVAQ